LKLSKLSGMTKNLVIVESPAKAKTIENYLGKEYIVKSSYGHVRDLPKDNEAIDIQNGFKPTYEIPKDKKDVIKQLKKEAENSDLVYLASDDDREGEAISWHLKEALDLSDDKVRRIVFREITKNAILSALESPRGINLDLVNAQQARRVLDRLVGFELSPVLWKKIKTGLSAGRVQSVAVKLVVEREREIEKFQIESFYRISAYFLVEGNVILKADLQKRLKNEEDAVEFLKSTIGSTYTIEKLEKKPLKKSPAPPFTTSTLQQEASRKLGFSVTQTMTIAQKLYEAGKISYMRTDSVNLSLEAISGAKNEILNEFGEAYLKTRQFKTKSQSAQEAHEAIRPTNFSVRDAGADRNAKRLYELIWKRAVASQMAAAQLEKTVVTIGISSRPDKLIATGEIITFSGFLKLYQESSDEENGENGKQGLLPPLSEGDNLQLKEMIAKQGFTRPPLRFTEASLVKKLEDLGIGRPSTYAPTISTIQKRNYVVKEFIEGKERNIKEITLNGDKISSHESTESYGFDKNKLSPTNIGIIVNDFLENHFPSIIDYSFTANVEEEFDEIAQGQIPWENMIDSFYGKFHPMVEKTETLTRAEASTSRELGIDPESGKMVYARLGKFGPMIQVGENDEEDKPRYASLLKGQFLESINLEEALDLFKLPREVGLYEDKEVVAGIGRFGPYIRHDNKFISLGKEDPLQVDIGTAIQLIEEKRKEESDSIIKVFEEQSDVKVVKGKYGPYIKFGKKNLKIPKDKIPEDLTFEECVEISEKAPAKKRRFNKK
jgi:DNA topoisomerase-1